MYNSHGARLTCLAVVVKVALQSVAQPVPFSNYNGHTARVHGTKTLFLAQDYPMCFSPVKAGYTNETPVQSFHSWQGFA